MIKKKDKVAVEDRPNCPACGLKLRQYDPKTFDRGRHWHLKASHRAKLTSEHTFDGKEPRFGWLGDNVVCNETCAHRLLVQLGQAIGADDLIRMLAKVAEPTKVIVKRSKPLKTDVDAAVRAFRKRYAKVAAEYAGDTYIVKLAYGENYGVFDRDGSHDSRCCPACRNYAHLFVVATHIDVRPYADESETRRNPWDLVALCRKCIPDNLKPAIRKRDPMRKEGADA